MIFINLNWYKNTLEVFKKLITNEISAATIIEPTEEDALELLSKTNTIELVRDNDGGVFTDKKGNIYIL